MVSVPQVQAFNSQLAADANPRVAVFVGATAGIGEATLKRLVQTGFPLKVYVIGRDRAAFTSLSNVGAGHVETIFLEGQISLMAEAARLCGKIEKQEKQIDLLYLSAGFLPLTGRKETPEGIEASLAVSYFSRQIFIRRLLPLLRQSASPSFKPRVVNILGTGNESASIFLDDLTLKELERFTLPNYAAHSTTLTSVSLKHLAEQPENQGIVFIHNHPGSVHTNLFQKSLAGAAPPPIPAGFSAKYDKFTPEEAGERGLFLITSPEFGKDGASEMLTVKGTASGSLFCVNDKLETLQLNGVLDELEKTGGADSIWKQTNDVIGAYV